jgi:hypothetical protein
MIIHNELLMILLKEKLGKKVRVFMRKGKLVVALLPDPSKKKKSTAKQIAARRRMKAVSAHVKELFKDPGVKAMYAARADVGQNAFNMAVKEYYKKGDITSF